MSEDFILQSINDLFHDEKSIIEINLSEIDEFPNHPFKVIENEDMENLKDSIKEHGVITPATVRRKKDGRYELISGHRRKKASELAGLKILKCEIVDISDEEAIVQMVDGNLQRTTILPSEKAFAYKMKLEAIKGSRQVGVGVSSVYKLSNDVSESERQIQRYIRLTFLIKPLLELVDENKLKMAAALELTFLENNNQEKLLHIMNRLDKIPTAKQAREIRDFFNENSLVSDKDIENVFFNKTNKDRQNKNINFNKVLDTVPENVEDIENYILQAIDYFKRFAP